MKRLQTALAGLLCAVMLLSLCGCLNPLDILGNHTNPDSLSEEEIFALLFDIQNTVTLDLDMPEAELQKMQQDYEYYDQQGSKSPIYRKADLTITITTPQGAQYRYHMEEVGVRMKGNTSRTGFYSQEEGIYNIIHLKLSFQETFDDAEQYGADARSWEQDARKERKNRTFATLEKLDLRWNRCDDSTYLKEYFAYETYRQYGVLAPRTNLCSFDWSGYHMGVFTINEPVDEVFLEKYLPTEAQGGDLYKVGWAGYTNGSFTSIDSIGVEKEENWEFYAYDLKTNKKTSTHQALTNLIRTLNRSQVTKESFAQLVDVDSFLAYCAVSYLLGNPDDMRNNYNNFYVYFRADNGKAVIIPYDYDRCLGITAHWNPTNNGVTNDNPFSLTLAADGSEQKNPLILYSVASGGYYVREYAALLNEIVRGDWFTMENFSRLYAIAADHYSHLAQPGKAFYNSKDLYMSFSLDRTSEFSSNGNISFRQYLNAKRETLDYYLARIDQFDDSQLQLPDGESELGPIWYIRADFTNWDIDSRHTMVREDGQWVYILTTDHQVRLKIYNPKVDRWYGTECMVPECTVFYETDAHTNLVLGPGSYRISIDPFTQQINLEYI